MAHHAKWTIHRFATGQRRISRVHGAAGRLGYSRLLFSGDVLRRARGFPDHDRDVDRDFRSAARARSRVESSVGSGEFESFMISGISVQPRTTASQPAAFMRAITL